MKDNKCCKNCHYYDKNKIMYGCKIFYSAFNHPVFEIDENSFYCNLFKKGKK